MKNYLKSPIVFLSIIALIVLCMAATDPIRHVILIGGTNVTINTGTTNANTYYTVNSAGGGGGGTGIATNSGSGTNNIFIGPTNISGLSISNALVDTITTNRVALLTNSVASIGWVEGVSNTLNGKISTGGIAVTDGVGTNTFITNALLANPNITNGILVTPSMTNGVNYGQAFRSKGAGLESLQLGPSASANGEASIAIGSSAEADNLDSIAIGPQATAQYNTSVAIGAGVVTIAAGEIRIGTSTNTVAIPGTMSIGNLNVNTLTATNPSTMILTNSRMISLNAGTLSSNQIANLNDVTNISTNITTLTGVTLWGTSGYTNKTFTDALGWHNTNHTTTGHADIQSGNISWSGIATGILASNHATNLVIWGSVGGTNRTFTDAQGWHNTNHTTAGHVDIASGNINPSGQIQYSINSLGFTNGVSTNGYVIDFDKPEYELTATTTNDTMFLITSNRLANLVRYTTINIYAVSNIDFAFNESWVWLGTTNNPPTALNAGKYGNLTLRCNGTATNNVTAVFSGQ